LSEGRPCPKPALAFDEIVRDRFTDQKIGPRRLALIGGDKYLYLRALIPFSAKGAEFLSRAWQTKRKSTEIHKKIAAAFAAVNEVVGAPGFALHGERPANPNSCEKSLFDFVGRRQEETVSLSRALASLEALKKDADDMESQMQSNIVDTPKHPAAKLWDVRIRM
jgi:hypothetical protein